MATYQIAKNTEEKAKEWPYPTILLKKQDGWGRTPLTDSPLPYTLRKYWRTKAVVSGQGAIPLSFGSLGFCTGYTDKSNSGVIPAMNKAIGKFRDQLSPQAALGTSLAEIGDSFAMIALRAGTLLKAYKALKRGKFRDFRKALDVRPLEKHKGTKFSKPKDASALWLEYWMGWAPMIGDVYSAIDVIQSDPPPLTISATSGTRAEIRLHTVNQNEERRRDGSLQVTCKVQADVAIRNPNLFLANSLGLVNPANVAWDLIPFSFMVGWFVNVSEFLANLSWDAGLTITNAFSTVFCRSRGDIIEELSWKDTWETKWTKNCISGWRFASVTRSPGIPPVRLYANLATYKDTRAATVVSLLVSIFTKG